MHASDPKSWGPPNGSKDQAAARQPSVLVVDDDPTFCAIMSEILKMYHVRVYTATSAEEALQLLTSITPDLILTDVMMPDVDGLTLVRQIRSEGPYTQVPVIVVSAGVSSYELSPNLGDGRGQAAAG